MLWSAPRCRSTAFLRMMHERGDFLVLHEPFSHLMDFGAADVGGRSCTDERSLINTLLSMAKRTAVFVKDTTDFRYPGVLRSERFLRDATHTFLIRHPRQAIASHYRVNPNLTCDEIGFARLREIHDAVEHVGNKPIVIDADDIVDDPSAAVLAYCRAVGIPFMPEALSWQAGVLPGWRRTLRWHAEVAVSTGIRPTEPAQIEIEDHPLLRDHYRHHLPHYTLLWKGRLRPALEP